MNVCTANPHFIKNHFIKFFISSLVVLSIVGYIIYSSPIKSKIFREIITNKIYIISTIIIIIFSIYSFTLEDVPDNLQFKRATFFGILAYVLSITASLQLTVTPFWLVWVIRFYIPY